MTQQQTKPDLPLQDIGFYLPPGFDGCVETEKGIELVLSKLRHKERWCCEFGAWDGVHGSTTRNLILNQGYSAVLIEGDAEKCRDLKKNYEGSAGIVSIQAYVGFEVGAPDSLDVLLGQTGIPQNFDFLTIDIDGNDYHVWESVVKYRAKIVMIEFNPTIPPEVIFVQPKDPSVNQGSSLAALVALGKSKGYELISVVGVNAFFATAECFPDFQITDNSINALWTRRDCVTYLFTGYDGKTFLRGSCRLPWHGSLTIDESRMQALPGWVQKYPHTRLRNRLYNAFYRPKATLLKLLKKTAQRLGISG